MDGEKPVELQFDLEGEAVPAQLIIKNSNGDLVRTIDLTQFEVGTNEFQFDSKDSNGDFLQAGNYSYEIITGDGEPVEGLTTYGNYLVDAVAFEGAAHTLTIENNMRFITGYSIPSATSSTNTDGHPPGYLSALLIDQGGIIQGLFTNGQVVDIAQLAISQFNNPKGLLRMGQNLFAETFASSTPAIGASGTGGRGTVVGSALEASNVDIAVEFTKMLVFERGYQANSRIITAANTLTQTALGIVR